MDPVTTDRLASHLKLISHTYTLSLSKFTAKLSQLVSDATEKFTEEETSITPPPIQILKVESECLAKVVEFLNHYETEPLDEITTPLTDNTFEGNVKQEWYREFVTVDNPMLFDLVTAANFMAIREYYFICMYMFMNIVILLQTVANLIFHSRQSEYCSSSFFFFSMLCLQHRTITRPNLPPGILSTHGEIGR